VNMLLCCYVAHVTPNEPSRAFEVLLINTKSALGKVTALNVRGDQNPAGDFDYVLSVGVIHHIPDLQPVIQSIYNSLNEGGKVFIGYMVKKETQHIFAHFKCSKLFQKRCRG